MAEAMIVKGGDNRNVVLWNWPSKQWAMVNGHGRVQTPTAPNAPRSAFCGFQALKSQRQWETQNPGALKHSAHTIQGMLYLPESKVASSY